MAEGRCASSALALSGCSMGGAGAAAEESGFGGSQGVGALRYRYGLPWESAGRLVVRSARLETVALGLLMRGWRDTLSSAWACLLVKTEGIAV